MTEEKLSRIDDIEADVFSAAERAVLAYASAMASNETERAEELVANLRPHFDDAQIVEITFAVAIQHGLNLFNNMLDIEPEEVVELLWRALRERVAPVRVEPFELDDDDDDKAAAVCPPQVTPQS